MPSRSFKYRNFARGIVEENKNLAKVRRESTILPIDPRCGHDLCYRVPEEKRKAYTSRSSWLIFVKCFIPDVHRCKIQMGWRCGSQNGKVQRRISNCHVSGRLESLSRSFDSVRAKDEDSMLLRRRKNWLGTEGWKGWSQYAPDDWMSLGNAWTRSRYSRSRG